MPEPTAEKPAGTTILTKTEPEKPAPETQLFKSEADKADALTAAKEAAIKELEEKTAAEKAAQEKAEAEKKAATEPPKTEKPKEPTPKKDGAASTEYTLTLPENSSLTQEDLDGLLKEAKESGLSEAEAKELLQQTDTVAKTAQTRLIQKQEQQMKTVVAGWKEAVKKDPELGGENLAATAIKSSRAFKAVASPAMQLFCEQTGYADHPEMVRMMMKVYDLIGEDRFIRGTVGATRTPTTTEEKARKLFGNPIKEAV